MTLGIYLATIAVLGVAVLGSVIFMLGTGEQSDIVRAERGRSAGSFRETRIRPLDRRFQHTRVGRFISTNLIQANLRSITSIEYLLITLLIAAIVFVVSSRYIALFYSILFALAIPLLAWKLLDVLKERQREKFIQQLPEFARIMANSTSAGLSIPTALGIAASELPDPAGREFAALKRELDLGAPLDDALERMASRISGRDLDVLVSTLVIAQRSGGSLISSLRNMSDTLEFRKETKREVKTLVSQSSYTGYLVVAFGVGFVLLLTTMNKNLLFDLTSTILGQIALAIAAACYITGIILINKLVKVKL